MAQVYVSTVVNAPQRPRLGARARLQRAAELASRASPRAGSRAASRQTRSAACAISGCATATASARSCSACRTTTCSAPTAILEFADGRRELCRDASADPGHRRRQDLHRMDGGIRLRAGARSRARQQASAAGCSRAASTRSSARSEAETMPHVVKSTIVDAPDRHGCGRCCAISTATTAGIRRSRPARSSAAIPSDKIGCVRRFTTQPTARNCASNCWPCRISNRRFSYCLLDTPIPHVQLCRPRAAAAGHRRRPHLLALGSRASPRRPGDEERLAEMVGEEIYQAGFEAVRQHLHEARMMREPIAMPRDCRNVRDAPQKPRPRSPVRPRRAFSWRRHARDARRQRGRCRISHARAHDDRALSQIRTIRARVSRSAPASRMNAARSRERDLAFLHPPARSIGGPAVRTYGDGRRQSVRAVAVWGPDYRAARARRNSVDDAGRLRRARHRARGISARAADAARARSSSASRCAARPAPEAFRYRKVARVKPKGVSVLSIAAFCRGVGGRVSGARIALARWRRRRCARKRAERALEGRTLDERRRRGSGRRGARGHSPGDRRDRQRLVSPRGRRRSSAAGCSLGGDG